MTRKRRIQPPAVPVQPGDHVLIGVLADAPDSWWIAEVIGLHGDDVATAHRSPSSHEIQRQFMRACHIRRRGSIDELAAYQRAFRAALQPQREAVQLAQQQLDAAKRDYDAACKAWCAAPPGDPA